MDTLIQDLHNYLDSGGSEAPISGDLNQVLADCSNV